MTRRRARVLALLLLPLAALLSLTRVATAQVPHTHHVAAAKATTAAKKKPKIIISSFSYTVPKHVVPGAKIKVINKDSVEHSVTSDDGAWPNLDVPAHSKATFTAPDKVGKYPFHCRFHPEMKGVLKVKKAK